MKLSHPRVIGMEYGQGTCGVAEFQCQEFLRPFCRCVWQRGLFYSIGKTLF